MILNRPDYFHYLEIVELNELVPEDLMDLKTGHRYHHRLIFPLNLARMQIPNPLHEILCYFSVRKAPYMVMVNLET